MTKNEFLEGLRKALGNDLDRETVQENVAYYDGYISVQVNIGRTEEEVTAELGDPWVIAQTIIDAEEAKRSLIVCDASAIFGNHTHCFCHIHR